MEVDFFHLSNNCNCRKLYWLAKREESKMKLSRGDTWLIQILYNDSCCHSGKTLVFLYYSWLV